MKKTIIGIGVILLIIIAFAFGYSQGEGREDKVSDITLYGTYNLYNDKNEKTQQLVSLSSTEAKYFYRYFNEAQEQETSEGTYVKQSDNAFLITSGTLENHLLVVENDYLYIIDNELHTIKYLKTSDQFTVL